MHGGGGWSAMVSALSPDLLLLCEANLQICLSCLLVNFIQLPMYELFANLDGLISIAIPLLCLLYTIVRVANLCIYFWP